MNTLALTTFFISLLLIFVSIILLALSGIKMVKNRNKEILSKTILDTPKKLLKIMGVFILINISSFVIFGFTLPKESKTNEIISVSTTNNPTSSMDSNSNTTIDEPTDSTSIEVDKSSNDKQNSNNSDNSITSIDSSNKSTESNNESNNTSDTISNDINSSHNETTNNNTPTTYSDTTDITDDNSAIIVNDTLVWKTQTGTKYHSTNHCGKTNPNNATSITLEEAERLGLEPCQKCYR